MVDETGSHYFGKTFNISSDGGTKLGVIVPARYFVPLSDITIDLPEDVPILVQVFMLWLAVKSWTTNASST